MGLVFALNCQGVLAKNISCDQLNNKVLLRIDDGAVLDLPSKNNCAFDFNLVENFESIGSVAVFVGPDQYGLNASYDVFVKNENGSDFSFAGNLPVSAVKVGVGLYRDSVQQGGGIYISTYEIKNRTIKPSIVSYLLLIDGKVCKSSAGLKVVYPGETDLCREIKRVNNKPYCLRVEGGKFSNATAKYCKH
jgi:hypothetical protein